MSKQLHQLVLTSRHGTSIYTFEAPNEFEELFPVGQGEHVDALAEVMEIGFEPGRDDEWVELERVTIDFQLTYRGMLEANTRYKDRKQPNTQPE